MLGASIVLNVLLVGLAGFIYWRAMVRAKEHKLATFAGCLGAISAGATQDDPVDQMQMMALGLRRPGD